jgi:hypothetical protein
VLANQNNNLGDVEDRVMQNEDQIKHIDDTIDGLDKTVAIFEGRHVETVEKMKEDHKALTREQMMRNLTTPSRIILLLMFVKKSLTWIIRYLSMMTLLYR